MINENFAYLAALINAVGGLRYFFLTLNGEVKPNKVTWFLWGIIPMIILFFQLREGVGVQVLLTFSVGIVPLMVFFCIFY